jgi:polyphosphate kinase
VSKTAPNLDHSRLCYFANAGAGEYYLGSADWMPRNFDRRVEAVAPADDPALHPRLQSLLQTCLSDNRQAWDLDADGTWRQRIPVGEVRATHTILMADSWGMSPQVAATPATSTAPLLAGGRQAGVPAD